MRITIDTKEDSYDDIKKVLHVLNHLIENKNSGSLSTNYEENKEPVDTTNMMNMFGAPAEEKPATAPDFSSFLNLAEKKEEKKDDLPKVELF